MGMAVSGRRNRLGCMHGPVNDPYLNPTHPALSAACGCNSDVQLPYRLPVIPENRSSTYTGACMKTMDDAAIAEAAQAAQDAQIGYCCDYQNKRNPICFHELKEFMKGHVELSRQLAGECRGYVGRRHVQRIISDFYGRGIVRGAVECVNLLVHADKADVLAAETMRTAPTQHFDGGSFLTAIESIDGSRASTRSRRKFPVIDRRKATQSRALATYRDILYGHRGTDARVRYLSPYEFTRHWTVQLARLPRNGSVEERDQAQVSLTSSGAQKVAQKDALLIAGLDYQVKEGGGPDWIPFPARGATQSFRHDWVMVRQVRPHVPVFAGCPMPRNRKSEEERNARLLLAYFHPWCLDEGDVCDEVPYAATLRRDRTFYAEALRDWIESGTVTMETAQHIQNYLCMSRLRPKEVEREEGHNSEDFLEDEPLDLAVGDLPEVLETRVGGKPEGSTESEDEETGNISHFNNSVAAISLGKEVWSAPVECENPIQDLFASQEYDHEAVWKEAKKSQKDDPWNKGTKHH